MTGNWCKRVRAYLISHSCVTALPTSLKQKKEQDSRSVCGFMRSLAQSYVRFSLTTCLFDIATRRIRVEPRSAMFGIAHARLPGCLPREDMLTLRLAHRQV